LLSEPKHYIYFTTPNLSFIPPFLNSIAKMYAKLAIVSALVAAVSAVDIPITVGANNLLTFTPNQVQANINDSLIFTFVSKNHTVWLSSFAEPCVSGGFTNGFFPINNDTAATTGNPTLVIQVTETTPLWMYCAQTIPVDHCQMGMVFAVNPTPAKTFAAFQATAMGLAINGTTNGTASAIPASAAPGASSAGSTPASAASGLPSGNPTASAPPAASNTTTGGNGADGLKMGSSLVLIGAVSAMMLAL